jgi:hypothetical protein
LPLKYPCVVKISSSGNKLYPCILAPRNANAAAPATTGSAVEPITPPVLVAVTNVVLPVDAVTLASEAVAVADASAATAVLLYTIDVYPLTVMGTLV